MNNIASFLQKRVRNGLRGRFFRYLDHLLRTAERPFGRHQVPAASCHEGVEAALLRVRHRGAGPEAAQHLLRSCRLRYGDLRVGVDVRLAIAIAWLYHGGGGQVEVRRKLLERHPQLKKTGAS